MDEVQEEEAKDAEVVTVMAPDPERIRQEAMANLEQLTEMAEMRLNDAQAPTTERQVAMMVKEFAEALVKYKKVNAALLAVNQDQDTKANLKTEYCTKVTLANEQLDLLYNRQEALKAANPANVPDPANLEENRRLNSIKVQLELALGNLTVVLAQRQTKLTDENIMKQPALIKSQVQKFNEFRAQIKTDTAVLLDSVTAGPLPDGEEANLTASLTVAANKGLADLSCFHEELRGALARLLVEEGSGV